MADINVFWEFSVFSPPIAATATTYRLANVSVPGTSFVVTGTGFTYDGNGIPTGGVITSVSMVINATISTPEVVLTTLTSIDISLGDFGARMSSDVALRNQLDWAGVLAADSFVSASSTVVRLANTDGTFTDIVGTGFDVTVPGSPQGAVSSIVHVASDGSTVLTTVLVNVSLQQAAAATSEGFAGEDLFLLLNSGDTTVTAVNNVVTIGLNTYSTNIQDGPGNDTLVGVAGPGGYGVDYDTATSGVTVNLLTGQATGGGGADTLTNITHVGGSVFADILIGDAQNNSLFGNEGDDTLSGGLGNDFLEGGDGTDTASYTDELGGVAVSLAIVGQQNTIGAGLDTLVGIENLIGSGFNDTLTGDGGANFLFGGAGAAE